MLARVSTIEAFRRWREADDQTVDDFIQYITVDEPSPAMLAGTAFHLAIEHAEHGDYDQFIANDHTFSLIGGEVELPTIREMRGYKAYGPLTVTGQVDGLHSRIVWDHKTTSRFDAERFLFGFQWRFYLDIFGADVFHWNVFEIKETGVCIYDVEPPHRLTAYRYPGMSEDCARLAAEYYEFAAVHLSPERRIAA